jgi:NitT/TauT family transport system ATP-binding protein
MVDVSSHNNHLSKIRAENLSKNFSGRSGQENIQVLYEINLNINDGEFVSILGPSGCGKSTLLYIIAGFVAPSKGKVLKDNIPIVGPGPDKGVIFQEYVLFPWLTVAKNIEFGLKVQNVPFEKRETVVNKYMEMMRLTRFRDAYIYELSGGMKQRVAIARTLAYEPDIILMDEPLGSLDAQTRELLQEEILQIWERTKKTIIFVTHSIEEAIFLSTRIVIMTARPGTIKEVLDLGDFFDEGKKMKSSIKFNQLREQIWNLIKDEVRKAQMGEIRGGL